jgi:CDGSH-type Zn-finger protein/truncated hemoglobin YjbI
MVPETETENGIEDAQAREELADAALALARRLRAQSQEDPRLARIATRLHDSVLRPLARDGRAPQTAEPPTAAAAAAAGAGSGPASDTAANTAADTDTATGADAELWRLATSATRLRARSAHDAALAEATAALQGLALALAEPSAAAAARLEELAALQAGLGAEIQVATNGPYLVTNARRVLDPLGRPIETTPLTALCRCGKSAIKPFCDGTHAAIGFTDAKDPDRVPDRRDTFVGQQVTVLDNRGVCQHSGLCTDRLDTVFHTGGDPFVTPSGGRMDEIVRAVRDCPSGALSYAVDGHEEREETDHHGVREPEIVVTADGPYRVTGGIALTDQTGEDHVRGEGASREHYALCRCGQSQNKPFCSGMHWYVQFRDPVPEAGHEPSIFEWAGGLPAFLRMTRLFYEKHVPADPLLAPLFATMSADHPERVAAWLSEVFGGPDVYSEQYGGYPWMLSQHVGKRLTEEQRARWVALILRSAREAGLPNDPEFRSAFSAYIEWGSRLAVENSQSDAKPPQNMPMPHWDWQTAAGPPGSRISALASAAGGEGREGGGTAQEPALPAPDEPVGFDRHIKTLFRARDRQSMRFTFDLWSYDDVNEHAEAIAQRVRDGSMPCDGAWPEDYVAAFQRWIDEGRQP